MQDQLSQIDAPATPAPPEPLRVAIARLIYGSDQLSVDHPFDAVKARQDLPVVNDAFDTADLIVKLLEETGHVLPGAPPAQQIMEDAKSFAARLTLSNLALRILNMLAWSNVQTPESKPARQWLEDYLEGKGHGPVGHPMLWPGRLPGLCSLLRQWGFVPTIATPGASSFVARAMPNPTPQ